jgi:hypothetical protein
MNQQKLVNIDQVISKMTSFDGKIILVKNKNLSSERHSGNKMEKLLGVKAALKSFLVCSTKDSLMIF